MIDNLKNIFKTSEYPINKVDHIIPIKDTDFGSNLFNDYQWIYHR